MRSAVPCKAWHGVPAANPPFDRRCCINRARSGDVYAQWSRGQPPIKSDSRVTA
ncbi:MAG: hypothetical protein V3Q69_01770 [Burkholderia sp.]